MKPSERGQRLYQLLLSLVAASHLQAGMERAVLTVDVTNSPAIKTVRRLGFRARASTKLVRWNRYRGPVIHWPTVTEHCTFGCYLGDGFKSKSQPFRALESKSLC